MRRIRAARPGTLARARTREGMDTRRRSEDMHVTLSIRLIYHPNRRTSCIRRYHFYMDLGTAFVITP